MTEIEARLERVAQLLKTCPECGKTKPVVEEACTACDAGVSIPDGWHLIGETSAGPYWRVVTPIGAIDADEEDITVTPTKSWITPEDAEAVAARLVEAAGIVRALQARAAR